MGKEVHSKYSHTDEGKNDTEVNNKNEIKTDSISRDHY
jgi:hypothetical protein